MQFKPLSYPVIFCLFVFFRCNSPKNNFDNAELSPIFQDLKTDTTIKYAKRFSVAENNNCKVVYLFGNAYNKDTTATFVFLKNSSFKLYDIKNTFVFKSFCKKIASLSSVYTNMLCELGEINHIAAIENIDYYNNRQVIDKHKLNLLTELSKGPEMDIEKTIVLNPDIIFSFGMGNADKKPNEKILLAKIPIVISVDHLEESPLARAEWIKFYSVFVNKELKADSIFKSVEKNYFELKNIAFKAKTKPSVFTEIKYGEIWYMPGGKSFAATFFNDANANYIWKDDAKTGSLNLGFEKVYLKAKDADFWLNLALVKSKKELQSIESRYCEFKAFKTGNLYNNIKNTNIKGYSDYWETGIIYPNRVLSDLILIFHPELKSQIKNDLYYYKKLD